MSNEMILTKEETDRGPLQEQVEENWLTLEPEARKRCVKALREYLEAEIDRPVLDKWRDQHERGKVIGSDDPWFHFGLGTAIRNILRLEVSENNLPWVEYPGGKKYRNWDDFYGAALREALGLDRA